MELVIAAVGCDGADGAGGQANEVLDPKTEAPNSKSPLLANALKVGSSTLPVWLRPNVR
jgi:hypothetical protein